MALENNPNSVRRRPSPQQDEPSLSDRQKDELSLSEQQPWSYQRIIINNPWVSTFLNIFPLIISTYSSVTAAYKARDDPWTLSFIFTAYTTLMLFFHYVGSFDRTPPEKKPRVKTIVFILAVILVILFPAKLTPSMHFALAALVWTMAGITLSVIFYLFFVYVPERP